MSQDIVIQIVAAACPLLALVLFFEWVAARRQWRLQGWRLLLRSTLIAAIVLLLPVSGLPIARHIAGVSAGFSITLTSLLAVAAWERAFGRQVFSDREWRTAWWFGAVAGIGLYPMALGIGSVDPYEWGWRFSPLFAVSGVLTIWLLWSRNRFGFALLLAAGAFQVGLLESNNYWDYLVDPVVVVVSFTGLVRRRPLAQGPATALPRSVP